MPPIYQAAALRGFSAAPNNLFKGAAGQLPGTPDFTAVALFRPVGQDLASKTIFGNQDSVPAAGWSIRFSGGGVVIASVVDSGAGEVTSTFDVSTLTYSGKLIHALLQVTGGALDLYVQGVVRDNNAIPNAYVPGVGVPTVGAYNDDGAPADIIDVVGCSYVEAALTPNQIHQHFAQCVEEGNLADLQYPDEPALAGGWANLWRSRDLVSGALQGAFTTGPVAVASAPLPSQNWADARDPAVFNRSAGAPANAPLITLAADGFATPAVGTGLLNIRNPSWL